MRSTDNTRGRCGAIEKLVLPASAVVALLVGTCVYIVDRDWASTRFLASIADWQPEGIAFFGSLGSTLPSFFHAYAFALLLILALRPYRYARPLGAAAWFLIASGLEYSQMAGSSVPAPALAGFPIMNSFYNYAVLGRYDPGDLWAAGLGCLLAFVVVSLLEIRR
jgi:hypothetical protein